MDSHIILVFCQLFSKGTQVSKQTLAVFKAFILDEIPLDWEFLKFAIKQGTAVAFRCIKWIDHVKWGHVDLLDMSVCVFLISRWKDVFILLPQLRLIWCSLVQFTFLFVRLCWLLIWGKLMPHFTISTATVPKPLPDEKCTWFHLN